jgi:3-oxoacyl-[acyl-carrier-protein] synthase II
MRDVVVTGVGIVSCAGEELDAHLAALRGGATPPLDTETFAPYPVHPAVALEWDRQIPKKSDQRQMEAWQRLGVYAAGLALDSAGAKDDAALKSRMHMVVAAGGGERDYAVDGQILSGLAKAENKGVFLNERLMNDLRPTLFLAQLSNLLAGNISIVHGITGGSRTFMGEEASGVDALRVARGRIASGEVDTVLVGSSYNAERPDVLLIYEIGGYLSRGPFRSVWDRPAGDGGLILGSAGCSVLLESRDHANARSAKILATFAGAVADRVRRTPGAIGDSLRTFWAGLGVGSDAAVLSGATGVSGITEEEQGALRDLAPGAAPRATGDVIGHTMETHAVAGFALAAALVAAGEAPEAVVTSVGHRRGEGMMRLVPGA